MQDQRIEKIADFAVNITKGTGNNLSRHRRSI